MPTISNDIWVTREGQQLEIKKMASSHLLATIHFIERKRFTEAVDCAMRESGGSDLVKYYLQWPYQYDSLVAEAQRRRLIYRGVEGTVKRVKQ
jgi:hypothetical protein